MKFLKFLILLIFLNPLYSASKVSGSFTCNNMAMVNEYNGKVTYLDGKEVWKINLKDNKGNLFMANNMNLNLNWVRSDRREKNWMHVFNISPNDAFSNISLVIDHGAAKGKAAIITKLNAPAPNVITALGFCN